MVPNRCKLQSLLAVSVTVPVYTNTENLIKWRADLQNKTPRFIEKVEKLRSGYAPIWDCHSRQPSLLHCCRNGRLNMVNLTLPQRARHPLRHSTELRRSAKLIFVRMKLIASE